MITSSDPLIRVDRTAELVYPPWVKTILHPEFRDSGPSEFDVRALESFQIPGHNSEVMDGGLIYEYQRTHDLFKGTVGLREFRAIQSRGLTFYRMFFKRTFVTSHKDAVRDLKGDMYVPFLCARSDIQAVVIDWCWSGNGHVHNKSVSLRYKA